MYNNQCKNVTKPIKMWSQPVCFHVYALIIWLCCNIRRESTSCYCERQNTLCLDLCIIHGLLWTTPGVIFWIEKIPQDTTVWMVDLCNVPIWIRNKVSILFLVWFCNQIPMKVVFSEGSVGPCWVEMAPLDKSLLN